MNALNASRQSTERFSDRVDDYVRYRPRYPVAVLDILRAETGLTPASTIADIGSGTGFSAELFLANGNEVFGVEPNPAMRAAAEQLLANQPRFVSVDGTAEATNLPGASFEYVTAGQAFHWFDIDDCKREVHRILRPAGWVVLLWNTRKLDSTPFLRAYEELLHQFGTDYKEVMHNNLQPAMFEKFFSPLPYTKRTTPSEQRFNLEGLAGRLLSSSYAPKPGHPNHEPMMKKLEEIFRDNATGGEVAFEYDTEVYFGRIN